MIDALALLGVLLLPFLLGSALLRRLGVRFGDDGLAWLGWCWPLGALTTALLTGLWMATGAEPRAGLMYLPPVGLWLALWFWPRPDATIGSAMRTSLVRRLAVALVALVAVLPLTRHALEEYGRPIHGDDDASIWTFKAVILAEHGRFDAALAEKLDERKTGAHHLDYPLLNPLLQVFILGATDERVAGALRWPSIFWALSLLALAGSAFLRAGGLLAGSLLWLAFAWAPAFQARVLGTKSDVITALGLLALIDAIGRLRATRSMALVAAMAAILVWSKNEGLMLACVVLIALGLRQGRSLLAGVWRPASLWLLLPLGVALGQWAFNRYYGLENDLLTGGAGRDDRPFFVMLGENLVDGERLQLIGRVFGYHFADITETIKFSNHGLYLVFIAACLVFPRRIWRSDAGLPALVAWGGIAAYFLVYVVSFEDLLWHLYTSSPRVLLHLLPVMVLTCAHLAGRLRPGGNAEKRSVTNDVQPTSLPENPSDRTSDPNARPAEDLPRQEGGPEAT